MVITVGKQYDKDFVSELRELKLKLISKDLHFKISQDATKQFKTELKFIKKTFPDDIITGSLALHLYGLNTRKEISDIDILIKDEGRYTGYANYNYGDEEKKTLNRLGVLRFDFKKNFFSFTKTYEVDFFRDLGAKYIEFHFEGVKLKLQHPIEIITQKMTMSRHHKHYRDLEGIFYKFGVL